MWPLIVGAILAAASAVSGGVQAKQQQQAIKDEKKARRQQTGIQLEENRRTAINTMREARIKSATIQAMAQNTGAKGTGELGSIASIKSQESSSIGFQNMQKQANLNTSQFLADSARAQGKGLAWGAASQAFGQASNIFLSKA
jgi:hypothetical protein